MGPVAGLKSVNNTITLNEAEQKLAHYLAKARYAANRDQSVVDRKVGPQSCEATDLEGIAAEIAFARIMNVYPDLDVGHRPDFDVSIPVGNSFITIDVKATKYPHGKLLAVPGKVTKPPRAYALVVGEMPRYRLAGFLPASARLRESTLTDLGHGPTHAVPQSRLVPWHVLLNLLS